MAALAMVAALFPAVPVEVPIPLDAFRGAPPPVIGAEAYVLYDMSGDLVLASHNADEPRAMASVTKLMTALVVLDSAQLSDPVVISEAAAGIGEAEVGVEAGETWTVWELLNAIVVRSGNDAATALAEHVGGSVEGFADLMNAKAAELGMTQTQFVNPHGLDAEGHVATANDLVILAVEALSDPVIARMARTQAVRFRPAPDGDLRRAINTNELLGAFDGVVGLKTGFTSNAKRVLVSAAGRGGRTLVGVVMGSEDHFADTRELLEYGFGMFGIADRAIAPLVGEQGGGTLPDVSGDEAARLRLLPELPDLDPDAPRRPTPLEEQLADALRRLVPPVLVAP